MALSCILWLPGLIFVSKAKMFIDKVKSFSGLSVQSSSCCNQNVTFFLPRLLRILFQVFIFSLQFYHNECLSCQPLQPLSLLSTWKIQMLPLEELRQCLTPDASASPLLLSSTTSNRLFIDTSCRYTPDIRCINLQNIFFWFLNLLENLFIWIAAAQHMRPAEFHLVLEPVIHSRADAWQHWLCIVNVFA